jgi:hypothetical protein
MLNRAALAACAILVITGGCFVRSPLLNPAGFVQSIEHAPSPKADDPHVLWIVLDTVRADHMSLHGYARDTTPRLAAFAKDALVFDRAIANGIWTLPSHTSMFTGQSVWEHGADHRNPQMPAGRATVAEVLSDHGYATAVFSNNPWVAPPTGLTRGFDDCHIIYHLRHVARSSIGAMIERLGVQPPLPWLDEDFGGALTNRLIADWLAQHTGDRSLFLFVNYMDAHLPYRVPRPFRAKLCHRSRWLGRTPWRSACMARSWTLWTGDSTSTGRISCRLAIGKFSSGSMTRGSPMSITGWASCSSSSSSAGCWTIRWW